MEFLKVQEWRFILQFSTYILQPVREIQTKSNTRKEKGGYWKQKNIHAVWKLLENEKYVPR